MQWNKPKISFSFNVTSYNKSTYSTSSVLGSKVEDEVVAPGLDPVQQLSDRLHAEVDRCIADFRRADAMGAFDEKKEDDS